MTMSANREEQNTMPGTPVFPIFVFTRQRDIERETGVTLAGHLIVDLPGSREPKRREQRMIREIVQRLSAEARSGEMPDDAFLFGWPGGAKPANAADLHDDALMSAWAKTRLCIVLRVDPRNDGLVRIDSDMRRQAGLPPEATTPDRGTSG
jgi:hypothetical protein